ncbi:MAG: hypothetical protein JXD18_14920, partial [Anaerolineae bacterium]|nr:hypothetical protein [Anaerolineae bacterium]
MARLAAQEKGEYYPTPLAVAEMIADMIQVHVQKDKPVLRLFDPCAGEGLALARIAEILAPRVPDGLTVETWGVEINERRAAEAATRLTHVVACPFEAAAWKPNRWGVASVLVLNPPYDFSSADSYTRMETWFLKQATPALETGGLLAYIVPPAALEWRGLQTLFEWYDEIEAYRFPDDLFERFKQMVIFGKRRGVRDRRAYPGGVLQELSRYAWGNQAAEMIRAKLPSLEHAEYTMTVPTTRVRASLYRSAWSKDEVAAKVEADAAPALSLALNDLYGPQEDVVLEPLVPPKRGHIAQALASGVMGTMAFPGEVLKGRAVKTREMVETTETSDTKGNPVTETRYKDRYHNHIVRVTPDGLEYLSDPTAVTQFLQANADRLAEVMKDRLQPYGDSATPEEEAILARLSPDRYLPGRDEAGLLPNQKETAIAATRSIRRYGIAHLVCEMGWGKTTTALGTLEVMGAYPALVVCPPHLVDKWEREAIDVIPGAQPVIVENITELEAVRRDHRPGDRTIVIMSRSRIKLGPGWKAASQTLRALPGAEHEGARKRFAGAVAAYKEARAAYLQAARDPSVSAEALEGLQERMRAARTAALEKAHTVPICPSCGQPVVDGKAIKDADALGKRPSKCPNTILEWDAEAEDYRKVRCGAALWQSDENGFRRWPLADYIAKKMRGFFKL